jgi:hypothetical protein
MICHTCVHRIIAFRGGAARAAGNSVFRNTTDDGWTIAYHSLIDYEHLQQRMFYNKVITNLKERINKLECSHGQTFSHDCSNGRRKSEIKSGEEAARKSQILKINVFDGNTKVKTMEKTAPSVTGTAPTDEEQMIDEDVEDQNDESNMAPADEEQMIDKVAENQDDASDTRLSRRARWMLSHRLGWLYRLPGEWPRTIALIFGVVRCFV